MNKLSPKKLIILIVILLTIFVGLYFLIHNNNKFETKSAVTNTQEEAYIGPKNEELKQIKDIPILVYHSIALPPTTRKESLLQKRFRVSPENFRYQMEYLKKNNYSPITFDHLAEYILHNKEIPEKPVVITFDDGLLSQYENAIPVLKEYNFVATFFIYTGVVSHRNFINWEQLAQVINNGNEIGSHTIIHYNLTKIDSSTLDNELTGSKKKLEDKLGISVKTFAYPDYAENETVRTAVDKAGYIAARAGWRTVKNSIDEIMHLNAQEAGNTKNPFVKP
ncbi:MAG: polysaccharide deacetylase family protein [Candidatus Nomurabacteria bacterium]|nr:polysaccharide deacetylase family protein [Candidatus Nomurabacteria bacterium]